MILRDKNYKERPKFEGKQVPKYLLGPAFLDAYDLTFGSDSWKKDKNTLFHALFIGKLGEQILAEQLRNSGFKCYRPEYYINNEGGDNGDLIVIYKNKTYRFSVKTTMYYGRFLTESVKHYNKNGVYKPGEKDIIFNRHYIIRVNQEVSKINLYQDKESLYKEVENLDWQYDIPGYITHEDFLEVIKAKHIINKGEMNFESDSYFVHQIDLHKLK